MGVRTIWPFTLYFTFLTLDMCHLILHDSFSLSDEEYLVANLGIVDIDCCEEENGDTALVSYLISI